MELVSADLADVGRLLGWAARPKDRPARHDDYRRVVRRYLEEQSFADACDQVAAGTGVELVVDADVGVVAVADSASALRMSASDFVRRSVPTERRALPGAILLAVAKVAFPHPGLLDDPLRVGRVSAAGVVDYLNRLVERVATDTDDPDADQPELVEVWRAWESLRQSRHDAQRSSSHDRAGAVKKVCAFLETEGLLIKMSDEDAGTWKATPRFRVAVRALVEDSDVFASILSPPATTSSGLAS